MVVFAIYIPVANPADKTIAELIPVVIMCVVIGIASLILAVYFIVPKKIKTKDTNIISSETMTFDGKHWKGQSADDVKEFLKIHSKNEEVLWEGGTSRIGGIMYSAKICLFLFLLLEIIFVIIAVFFDIGLSNKLKTFFVLQLGLIMLAVIFLIMCFMSADFSYQITNEKVYLYYNNIPKVYDIKDIISIKIKYALYERNKQFGTIKVKVKNRRIAPMRNHLYSIPKPQEVYDILQNCINSQTEKTGYQAEVFEDKKCAKCGEAIFAVEGNSEQQLYRIVCKNCGEMEYIEDSADFWDDSDDENLQYFCPDKKGHSALYITLGYALREDNSKKWLYIGFRCSECGIIGCIDDIKIDGDCII